MPSSMNEQIKGDIMSDAAISNICIAVMVCAYFAYQAYVGRQK